MKRLFCLGYFGGGRGMFQGIPSCNGPLSFDNKKDAKARRDEINSNPVLGYSVHVTYGPDHPKFKGAI